MMRRFLTLLIAALACTINIRADMLTTFDFDEWQSSVADFSTIDFTGLPEGTLISNQYANMGVTFTGAAFIIGPTPGFVNDGWGLHGPSDLHLFFDEPQTWVAVHHAATALFQLYYEGELIGTSDFDPVAGIGSFLGVFSTVQFDEVIITTQPPYGPHILIDDLHWGSPVPAPSALALFALTMLNIRRRRRQ